jgi:hypothetical protein
MKALFIFFIFFSIHSFAANVNYYMRGPGGRPVQVLTPQDLKKMQENKELKGQGQVFYTTAEVKDNSVTAFVSGCGHVSLGDLSDNSDPVLFAKLKKLKNGQNIKLRMKIYGKCEVGEWSEN